MSPKQPTPSESGRKRRTPLTSFRNHSFKEMTVFNVRNILLIGLLLLMGLPLAAQEPVTCRARDLSAHPFRNGGLSLTVASLSGYKSFDRERKFSGRANILLAVENTGSGFQLYAPNDLNLVGKDGVQVFPMFERNLADDLLPAAIRLAPGAHVNVEYALSGRLHFPARVYLGERLVAVITE